MSYNVLQEKWIPLSDGNKYSLLECLEHAHELERISCTSPLETYAVHRFLCAFIMDALQLPNRSARLALLKQDHFDMAVFEAYISMCIQEGTSFDLFDPNRPFLQAAYNPRFDLSDKPAAVLVPDVPSGNNHIFLEHKMADEHLLQIDVAFRQLMMSYVFCTAAAQGYPSSVNNTPCLYVTVHGKNLFETLVLNCISNKEAGNLPYGQPAWRDASELVPKTEYAGVELLQGLTWQPRRVTLLKSDDTLIKRVYFSQGKNFKGNHLWRDPHVPYRMLKDGTFSSIKPASGRSLWRDLGSLAVSKENRYGKQPQVIAALPEEYASCKIAVTGLITSNATLVDTVHEELLVPCNILNDEELGETLHRDLDFVEATNRLIRKAFGDDLPLSLCDDAQNNFLAAIKEYVFGTYLHDLSHCLSDENLIDLQNRFEEHVLRCLHATLEHLSLRMGFDANNIILQASIRRHLLNGYNKLRRERHDD